MHCVHWGEFAEPVPAATVVEKAPIASKASVQRTSVGGPFTSHSDLKAPKFGATKAETEEAAPSAAEPPALETGVAFSPGWFSVSGKK